MKSQSVFQALLLLICLVAIPLSRSILGRGCRETLPPSSCPKMTDFWLSLVFGAGFIVARYIFVKAAAPLGRCIVVRGKTSDRVYELKVKRFSHHFFQFLYFGCVTYLAYRVLQPQDFFPKEFGGTGAMDSLYSVPHTLSIIDPFTLKFIKNYFFLSAGFHLASVYFLLVGGDYHFMHFWETCVQVVLAFELIVFGYTAQHLTDGAILMLIHDACDILSFGCKALVDTSYKVTAFMGAVILMTMWAYGRLFCLTKLILVPVLRDIEYSGISGNQEEVLFTVLLLCLFFMNIYWFSLMTKSCWTFVNSGRVRDLHAPTISDEKKHGE